MVPEHWYLLQPHSKVLLDRLSVRQRINAWNCQQTSCSCHRASRDSHTKFPTRMRKLADKTFSHHWQKQKPDTCLPGKSYSPAAKRYLDNRLCTVKSKSVSTTNSAMPTAVMDTWVVRLTCMFANVSYLWLLVDKPNCHYSCSNDN